MGPKMQDFCPKIDMLKGNCFKTILQWWLIKKCSNRTFKVNFLCQKPTESFKNINLGDHSLKKPFFSNFNFWTTLFSKSMPNFWWTGAPRILKIQSFPLSILIFGQKSYFLWPTISKIPQPNWYYVKTSIQESEFDLWFLLQFQLWSIGQWEIWPANLPTELILH